MNYPYKNLIFYLKLVRNRLNFTFFTQRNWVRQLVFQHSRVGGGYWFLTSCMDTETSYARTHGRTDEFIGPSRKRGSKTTGIETWDWNILLGDHTFMTYIQNCSKLVPLPPRTRPNYDIPSPLDRHMAVRFLLGQEARVQRRKGETRGQN